MKDDDKAIHIDDRARILRNAMTSSTNAATSAVINAGINAGLRNAVTSGSYIPNNNTISARTLSSAMSHIVTKEQDQGPVVLSRCRYVSIEQCPDEIHVKFLSNQIEASYISNDMINWLDINMQGLYSYKSRGQKSLLSHILMFEQPEDKAMFVLRYGGK